MRTRMLPHTLASADSRRASAAGKVRMRTDEAAAETFADKQLAGTSYVSACSFIRKHMLTRSMCSTDSSSSYLLYIFYTL